MVREWFLAGYEGRETVIFLSDSLPVHNMFRYRNIDNLVRMSGEPFDHTKLTLTSLGAAEENRYPIIEARYPLDLSDEMKEIGGEALGDMMHVMLITKWHWLHHGRIVVDNDGYIITCRNPKYYFTPERWVRASLAKTLDWMRSKGLVTRTFTPAEIERATYALSVNKRIDRLSHQIVTGEEVYKAYQVWPWAGKMASCMTGSDATRFYANNPDKVSLIKIYDGDAYKSTAKWKGRALLWTCDDGRKVVDRVYPADLGVHFEYVKRLAQRENWLMADVPSIRPIAVRVSNLKRYVWGYPHLDTMYVDTRYESDDSVDLYIP